MRKSRKEQIEKKRLEIAKLREEVEKVKLEREAAARNLRWWQKPVAEMKVSEWATIAAALVAVYIAATTDFFNAARERHQAQNDRLAVERAHLQEEKRRLDAEIAAKAAELGSLKDRLRPFETEEGAIRELRAMQKKLLDVRFEVTPAFDSIYVTIQGADTESGGRVFLVNKGNLDSPNFQAFFQARTNPHLGAAINAANQLRALKRLTISELRLSPDDLALASERTDLEALIINHGEMDRDAVSRLKIQKALWRLDLADNKVTSFDRIGPFEGMGAVVVRNNPISDDGLKTLLVAFPGVKMLDLSGTAVTDRAFDDLSKLQEIWHLDVRRTAVTDQGVARLLSRSAEVLSQGVSQPEVVGVDASGLQRPPG